MPPSTEGRWSDEAAGQCVSAGSGRRYDGQSKLHPLAQELCRRYEVIPVCGEVLGGAAQLPRLPSERGRAACLQATAVMSPMPSAGGRRRWCVWPGSPGAGGHSEGAQPLLAAPGRAYDGHLHRNGGGGLGRDGGTAAPEGIPVLGESRMGELLTEDEACLVKITRDPAKKL